MGAWPQCWGDGARDHLGLLTITEQLISWGHRKCSKHLQQSVSRAAWCLLQPPLPLDSAARLAAPDAANATQLAEQQAALGAQACSRGNPRRSKAILVGKCLPLTADSLAAASHYFRSWVWPSKPPSLLCHLRRPADCRGVLHGLPDSLKKGTSGVAGAAGPAEQPVTGPGEWRLLTPDQNSKTRNL